jgi:carbohydrate ABC transporter substrate-binding protein, CUT1 family (TC 3.A.1.1.-)
VLVPTGDPTLMPYIKLAADELMKAHPGVQITVEPVPFGYSACRSRWSSATCWYIEVHLQQRDAAGRVQAGIRPQHVLIHEATCNEQNAEICAKYAHTTTLQAVKEADAAGAHLLVLTHIDDGFNPTIYRDVKNIGRRDVVIAEDNMWLRI